MIALLAEDALVELARRLLFTWPGLVIVLAATSWAIYAVARRGRNAKTFKKALAPAAFGFLIALGGSAALLFLGKHEGGPPLPTRLEILGAPAIVGAEDLAIIPGRSPRLLVAAADRRKAGLEKDGALFLVDPARRYAPLEPLEFEGRDGCSFRPHGIDVFQSGTEIRIFVINHHLARDTDPERGCQPALHAPSKPMESIEIFVYQGPDRPLHFVERLQDPLLGHPNDLAAAGPDHLFATVPNTGLVELWNKLWGRCTGRIVEWNHREWSERADDLCFPNGIAVRKGTPVSAPRQAEEGGPRLLPPPGSDQTVWVVTSMDGGLYRLSDRTSLPGVFGSGAPDNLSWEGDDLLVAIHASGMRFFAAGFSAEIDGPPIASPGCVVRLRAPDFRQPTGGALACPAENEASSNPDVLFHGDGERMSAISAAVCLGGDLYLGQVIERGIGRVEGVCPSPPGVATWP